MSPCLSVSLGSDSTADDVRNAVLGQYNWSSP